MRLLRTLSRVCVLLALAAVALLTSCKSTPDTPAPSNERSTPATRAVAPATNQTSILVAPTVVGKIASANQQGKFVVIMFPIGQVPAADKRMVVYRGDAKVGEVRITGPTQENITVGDIAVGTAQEGDEVRDH